MFYCKKVYLQDKRNIRPGQIVEAFRFCNRFNEKTRTNSIGFRFCLNEKHRNRKSSLQLSLCSEGRYTARSEISSELYTFFTTQHLYGYFHLTKA